MGVIKLLEYPAQLSAEAGGRRLLLSCHGTHLRAYDSEWKVDMTFEGPKAWERWHVEDWKGEVVFKASPGRFLRAHPDGRVDLVDRAEEWVTWTPLKNSDGSWSFLSYHGKWLSANEDGSVCTKEERSHLAHFWLGCW